MFFMELRVAFATAGAVAVGTIGAAASVVLEQSGVFFEILLLSFSKLYSTHITGVGLLSYLLPNMPYLHFAILN